MNNKERGERIRLQILRDVKYHPTDIAKHIAKIFSITPQAVYNHIKRLEKGDLISSSTMDSEKHTRNNSNNHFSIFYLFPVF